ncbi:MAG: DUF4384 domain-containing protein [Candidatus Eremiobacteraeota bacterium]|nr:DUF4384 domain-containing protein [Candidatus Eremiobacteraeota bacterium]
MHIAGSLTKIAGIALLILLWCSTTVLAKSYLISGENLGRDAEWARFSVKIQTAKKAYMTGENVVATVTADRDCYFLVYCTNESGFCLIIYPNQYAAKNTLKAGESLVLGDDPQGSFSLEVQPEKERDYLQVIATEEPISTASLAGITDPAEFVKKVRMILRERVLRHAAKREHTGPAALSERVFAIGTTDYTCNYDSYYPPGVEAPTTPPIVADTKAPVIEIRRVEAPAKAVFLVGPDAPSVKQMKNNIYIVNSTSAVITGTVTHRSGIRKILVNGTPPTIKRIGATKASAPGEKRIVIEEGREVPVPVLDFEYELKGLSPVPREVIVTAEGLDGTVTKEVLRLRKN